jgi:hypothetical protein
MTPGGEGREWYDAVYGGLAEEVNAAIRADAFGEEIGQNSWLTADEHRAFFDLLDIDGSDEVLEVASGSGGPALFMVRESGCHVTGVDLHDEGVAAANAAAAAADVGLAERARFLHVDAREPLPSTTRASMRSSASTRSTTSTSASRCCATGTACCAPTGAEHDGRRGSVAERARHEPQLDEIEGREANAGFQDFLGAVELLASERRLSRLAFLARKPAPA